MVCARRVFGTQNHLLRQQGPKYGLDCKRKLLGVLHFCLHLEMIAQHLLKRTRHRACMRKNKMQITLPSVAAPSAAPDPSGADRAP